MPFIVTTKQRCASTTDSCHGDFDVNACVCDGRVTSRRAVATLDGRDVYDALYETPLYDKLRASELIAALPGSGGTIRSDDGTVIEVEPVEWRALIEVVGGGKGVPTIDSAAAHWPTPEQKVAIIAAYNAKQASA